MDNVFNFGMVYKLNRMKKRTITYIRTVLKSVDEIHCTCVSNTYKSKQRSDCFLTLVFLFITQISRFFCLINKLLITQKRRSFLSIKQKMRHFLCNRQFLFVY